MKIGRYTLLYIHLPISIKNLDDFSIKLIINQ